MAVVVELRASKFIKQIYVSTECEGQDSAIILLFHEYKTLEFNEPTEIYWHPSNHVIHVWSAQ